jgi:hypothetical protein
VASTGGIGRIVKRTCGGKRKFAVTLMCITHYVVLMIVGISHVHNMHAMTCEWRERCLP